MIQPKGLPWQYVGTQNVSECTTSKEVMETAKLNWEVGKAELFAKIPMDCEIGSDSYLDKINEAKELGGHVRGKNVFNPAEGMYATYRKDYNIPLGIVKDRYTIVQNSDAFKFFDDVIGKNKAIWQTAGYFNNGSRIFVTAKLPDDILVNGDLVDNYLVFTNSHNGSSGVKILFTPIRVVCQNTLNAAIRTSTNFVSLRHTESVHYKISIAEEVLGITRRKIDEFGIAAKQLSDIKVTDADVLEYICEQFLTEEEINRLKYTGHTYGQLAARDGGAAYDAEISTRKINMIASTWEYYFEGIGQKEIIGTAWGAANAISGYYSNIDNSEGAKRMDSILYGDKSNKIAKAFDAAFMLS